jgi:hypothetical protein
MAKRNRKQTVTMATREAQAMVVQAYWNNDQDCKKAKAARDSVHDLALLAVPKGETAGPATDADGMPHWLTHGEREHVDISAKALWETLQGALEYCSVDAGRLKEDYPIVYRQMLKYRSTKRTKHDCLTWADKPKPKGKRI